MAQSLSEIYIHLSFSTYLRRLYLKADARNIIIPYIAGIMKKLGAPALKIGGGDEHLHILFRMPKDKSLMAILQIIKRDSSIFIKTQGSKHSRFRWQAGYYGVSVSPSGLPRVMRYIENQERHHRTESYREEVLGMLKSANIEYDERLLWD